MLNTKVLTPAPNSLSFRKPKESAELIIRGQGVLLFATNTPTEFTFFNTDQSDGLKVSLTETEFTTTRLSNSNKYESQGKKSGLVSNSGAYYWFSLDSQNQRFYAGVGEPRIETNCYVYQFDPKDRLWEANKIFLESLVSVAIPETLQPLRLLKNPITEAVPLLVRDTEALTMDDVAGTTYLSCGSLSPVAKSLYSSISGRNFILNTPDFPEFSDAIEYSIATPGLWCNTRLKEKATEFDSVPRPLETYLRITLGQNNGESPGIPYVMEIWPVGHFSPVHNHAGANAIIRVLHGAIQVSLFPYLCDQPTGVSPFSVASFKKDDITWISPTLNQIHQLKNLDSNTETCITIQCYMYNISDRSHYDYFDYLGAENAKNQYEPDSDMEFLAFKQKMRDEWAARPQVSVSETAATTVPVVPPKIMFLLLLGL